MPATSSPPEPLRILVVEDEARLRGVVVRMLQRRMCDVIGAASGAEALALLAQDAGTIRLVVADVVMPGMNGAHLAACIAADFPAVAVVFMSGHDRERLRRLGVLDSAHPLLTKPFSGDALMDQIAIAIGRHSAAGGTAAFPPPKMHDKL